MLQDKLRCYKKTLLKIWGDPNEVEKNSSDMEHLVYENAQFWLESNKITQIVIYNLYEGKTKGGIELGSTKERGRRNIWFSFMGWYMACKRSPIWYWL